MEFLAFTLAYSGLAGLCLAMERHHRSAFERTPTWQTAAGMRAVAGAVLAASIIPSVLAHPGSTGYIAWFGFVAAAGLALIFLLPYAPRVATALAIGAPLLGCITAAV
jgi:hypothetical protein